MDSFNNFEYITPWWIKKKIYVNGRIIIVKNSKWKKRRLKYCQYCNTVCTQNTFFGITTMRVWNFWNRAEYFYMKNLFHIAIVSRYYITHDNNNCLSFHRACDENNAIINVLVMHTLTFPSRVKFWRFLLLSSWQFSATDFSDVVIQ